MKKFLIATTLGFAIAVGAHAKERSVSYGPLVLYSPEMQFQDRTYFEGKVKDGDEMSEMKFCSRESEFRCAKTEGFVWEFAVPRRALALHDHWKFGHFAYDVHPGMKVAIPGGIIPDSEFLQQSISILGKEVHFIVIDAHSDEPEHARIDRFLYSPEIGLIAYAGCLKSEDCKEFAWLRSDFGFCSDKFEQSLPNERFFTDEEFKQEFSGN